ncbi:MAG: hypothetical protein PHD43_23150 [Methylococcales bacterium]|nr:hypothetical protein [Methylococcales bacterium]
MATPHPSPSGPSLQSSDPGTLHSEAGGAGQHLDDISLSDATAQPVRNTIRFSRK